eukprot:4663893-Amphidinium_carterae.1
MDPSTGASSVFNTHTHMKRKFAHHAQPVKQAHTAKADGAMRSVLCGASNGLAAFVTANVMTEPLACTAIWPR